jgi:hypothetical protein
VLRGQMLKPLVPVRARKIWKFHTTIATRVVGRACVWLPSWRIWRMKRSLIASESGTRPGVAP